MSKLKEIQYILMPTKAIYYIYHGMNSTMAKIFLSIWVYRKKTFHNQTCIACIRRKKMCEFTVALEFLRVFLIPNFTRNTHFKTYQSHLTFPTVNNIKQGKVNVQLLKKHSKYLKNSHIFPRKTSTPYIFDGSTPTTLRYFQSLYNSSVHATV